MRLGCGTIQEIAPSLDDWSARFIGPFECDGNLSPCGKLFGELLQCVTGDRANLIRQFRNALFLIVQDRRLAIGCLCQKRAIGRSVVGNANNGQVFRFK